MCYDALERYDQNRPLENFSICQSYRIDLKTLLGIIILLSQSEEKRKVLFPCTACLDECSCVMRQLQPLTALDN